METEVISLDVRRQADSVVTLQEMMNGEVGDSALEYVKRQESLYFSELLEGQAKSEGYFGLLDGQIIGYDTDGTKFDWLSIHKNGVKYAKERASEDSRLLPYVEIAKAELAEAKLQKMLIEQPVPSTMVVYSLSGIDILDEQSLLVLGRQPELNRGFKRVSVFDGQGGMVVFSRSINGLSASDVVQECHAEFGIMLDSNLNTVDLLKNPIILDYADYELADKISPVQGIDTKRFVQQQTDLISAHMNGLEAIAQRYLNPEQTASLSEGLRYDIVSSLKQRLEGKWQNQGSLGASIAYAGNIEREAGTQYYGCDTALTVRAERLGYFTTSEDKTECVTCPSCSKVVNLPKEMHAKGYLHCVQCHSTYSNNDKRMLSKKEAKALLDYDNDNTANKSQALPELSKWWNKIKLDTKQKRYRAEQSKIKNN